MFLLYITVLYKQDLIVLFQFIITSSLYPAF